MVEFWIQLTFPYHSQISFNLIYTGSVNLQRNYFNHYFSQHPEAVGGHRHRPDLPNHHFSRHQFAHQRDYPNDC